MIYFEYCRPDGSILASIIPQDASSDPFFINPQENSVYKKSRNLFIQTTKGSVRLLFVNEVDYAKSSSSAKKLFDAHVAVYDAVLQLESESIRKISETLQLFAHNLIDVHTHLIGKMGRIFTDDVRHCANYVEQKDAVRQKIQADPEMAADDFCQISKRVDDLEAQMSTISLLSGIARKQRPNKGLYNFRRILLRQAQPFFEELKSLDIDLNFFDDEEIYNANKVVVDPKMINAALHHFFQNATKYCLPGTSIDVEFISGEKRSIRIKMMSLRIEKSELATVFKKGISGINTGELAGEGIGMHVIKSALEHFGASISIHPIYSHSEKYRDRQYVENSFIFEFPNS